MKDFMLSAGGLTKNPLGVVGLFVCLVYGLACAVFLVNGRDFECGESWVLVCFVALFPCVILFVFYRLVTLHHKKLYAPSDYKDELNFMSMMSDARISMRLDEQIEKNVMAEPVAMLPSNDENKVKDVGPGLVARQGKSNKLYFNLDEKKAKRAEYGDAKRLAFIALEKVIGKPFIKYVKFTIEDKEFELDGYLESSAEVHVIDVIYLEHPEMIDDYVSDFVKRVVPVFNRNDQVRGAKKTVWFGIVYPFARAELLSSGITKMSPSDSGLSNLTVSRQFLSLDELKQTYG